jgi:5,10-methylene-tetrahydrofolate dehydrogenase/methenyl tetrahydrofolate cyclohydrolase
MSTAMQTDAPPPPQVLGILLKSDSVAAPYKSEVQASLQEYKLKNRNRSPKLIGILATKSGPSESYAEFTKKTCEDLGITFELRKTGAALQAEGKAEDGTVEDAIIEANEDESVDGIMVKSLAYAKNKLLAEIVYSRFIIRFSADCKITISNRSREAPSLFILNH